MRVGISTTESRPGGAAGAGAGVRPRWPARTCPARSPPPSRTSCPRSARRRLHRRRPRPRDQGEHPADAGRARHRDPRAAGHRDARRRARGRRRTGCSSPTAPATRRRRPARSSCCAGRSSEGIPYFGICFGNQLFGRALGFDTYKLTYGHRGINQPVLDRTTGKVEVTAHNHGFAVRAPARRRDQTPYGEATVSHVCLNDDVVEGLELRDDGGRLTAFSVQYHPEAAAGPHDAAYLFDRFCDLMARLNIGEGV